MQAPNMMMKGSEAANRGVIRSLSSPKRGLPAPLNRAKIETLNAAVIGSILMSSCPTGLAIPIAINPLNVPMR